MQQHIYLLGPMGSGKSRLGKGLAAKLGMPLIDLDHCIEKITARTIKEIFETDGEDYFRQFERECLHKLVQQPPSVVSLGGGTPCFFDNMEVIKATGRSIYLQTPISILVARLAKGKTIRPLVSGKSNEDIQAFLQNQLREREQYYLQADIIVHNNGRLKISDLTALLV